MRKELTLAELTRKVSEYDEQHKGKMRQRYQLARNLGFTSSEAMFLQSKNEELIRKLAKEKEALTNAYRD